MRIQALIFDVDGTLADTEEAHRVAFNLAFDHYHLGWAWQRREYRELLRVAGGKERLRSYIHALTIGEAERGRLLALVPEIHAEKTHIYSSFIEARSVPLREGIARLLDEALTAGCRLAIASTTTPVNIDKLLQATLGARAAAMFGEIACGDQVPAKKPAPDVYRLALNRLGLPPESAVAFEDSANGLQSAVGAGLWTVVTPTFWTESDDFSCASLVLPRLGEPGCPLHGEPGNRLRSAAWLTLEEIESRVIGGPAAKAPRQEERRA